MLGMTANKVLTARYANGLASQAMAKNVLGLTGDLACPGIGPAGTDRITADDRIVRRFDIYCLAVRPETHNRRGT